MDSLGKKKTPAQREANNDTVQDLRNRVEGNVRFSRTLNGYKCSQVDEYLREQNAALTRERQEHTDQLTLLRQELAQLKATTAAEAEQQGLARRERQEQLENLSAALQGKEDQLVESEAQLSVARQGGEETQRLTGQVRELSTEKLRLEGEANALRCQVAARDQLADQLRQKNRELETAMDKLRQQVLSDALDHQRGLDGLRAVQSDCTVTLGSQLRCCLELLDKYQQDMETQLKLTATEKGDD